MGIFTKLFTALRGGLNEAGEAVVDSQAIRILDQEIRDAKQHLDEAKQNLTKVMAEQIGVEREVKKLQANITEYEGYAIQALDKSDEHLAAEIATKIAGLEDELAAQQAILDSYNTNIQELKQAIRQTERNIRAMEREISVVKTTESVQKANIQASSQFTHSDSALRSAKASLERIREKQQRKNDEMKAAMALQQEENNGELHTKLREAGILKPESSGDDVLERLKANRLKVKM
ncbi:PspA/IM30 family protein [Candidatus Albibeggiatoa sp. nov. NOAA]|uniref:PspA/IM30 family protein n=1 Tax=Candidatus Albibeggiatoa sp. nov. NOAA TaxID=3162724 RepID=UPI0032F488AE|nr:PspA/IM30 family protein [Thiotrichaceae bacterium]